MLKNLIYWNLERVKICVNFSYFKLGNNAARYRASVETC